MSVAENKFVTHFLLHFFPNSIFLVKAKSGKTGVAGLPDFSWSKIPKRGKIHQIITKYTIWPQNISNGRKIDQMVIKYTKNFHSKTLQNLPKLGFLV
jgi:hypothetical protein